MASLVKNGDTYGLIWTDNSREQSQCRESLKTDNLKKAKRRKSRLETQYYEGTHDPWERKWYQRKSADNIAITDAVEEFIVYKSRAKGQDGWSESVAKRETYVMRKFARHVGPGRYLSSLTENDLEDFYYRDGVSSDHTRNGNRISVTTFLNWCQQQGYIEDPPQYRPKKPQRKVPKFIYPKQLSKLIGWRLDKIASDIADHEQFDIEDRGAYWVIYGWMILAGTGMRPGELANVKVSHVESDSILIGEDFTTKVRAERRVPLLYESRQAVEVLINQQFRNKERYMADSNYLLGRKPSYAKKQLSEEFRHAWRAVFPDKPRRTLYNLKDMFCVRFLSDDSIPTSSGMKLNDLKEILGHSSLKTTEKYLKAIPYGTSLTGTIWDYPPL